MKKSSKELLKKTAFWSSVVLLPGGSLLLAYALLKNAKLHKRVSSAIRKTRKKRNNK